MTHALQKATAGSFGECVRRKREALARRNSEFSLRRVATRCGVTPAYLSRIERNEVAPPGEDTLVKLARDLEEDPDIMLALAGKISSDLKSAILARPQLFAELIRTVRDAPEHAILKVVREVKDGDW